MCGGGWWRAGGGWRARVLCTQLGVRCEQPSGAAHMRPRVTPARRRAAAPANAAAAACCLLPAAQAPKLALSPEERVTIPLLNSDEGWAKRDK